MNDRPEDPRSAPPPPGATHGVSGWYPDPWSTKRRRFWTGEAWTFSTKEGVAPGASEPAPQAVPSPPAPAPEGSGTGTAGPDASPGWAVRAGRALRKPRLLAAVVVGLLLGLAGVAILDRSSESSRSATAPPSTVTPPFPGSTSPPATADPTTEALLALVVKPEDVDPPLTVTVFPGGVGLRQPTLDLCNGTFPSETRRTARVQDAVVDGQGTVVLSTEAVLYADAAAAAQALDELRAVAATCPGVPVPDPAGGSATITTFNPPPDSDWPRSPTVERLAFDVTIDDGTGAPTHLVAVYLQRGRALLGVYFLQPDAPQPAVAGETTFRDIAGVFAERLAGLPASVVGS